MTSPLALRTRRCHGVRLAPRPRPRPRPRPCTSSRDRRRAGFTLLEVLAAALIFAMTVTVLIGTSSAGVQMSGVSARRLEASLLADAELAQIEMALNQQLTPPPEKESTDDVYAVRVLVEPALPAAGPNTAAPSAGSLDGASGLAAILATEAPGLDAYLLLYEIRVEWLEGVRPMAVSRKTFAFDWAGAQAALPDLFPQLGADASGGIGDPLNPGEANNGQIPEVPLPRGPGRNRDRDRDRDRKE